MTQELRPDAERIIDRLDEEKRERKVTIYEILGPDTPAFHVFLSTVTATEARLAHDEKYPCASIIADAMLLGVWLGANYGRKA